MDNFDLTKFLAEGKLLKENIDFPELEDEFEGAMDAMVVEPEVYLQDIIDASAEEIVSDDYYEIMNAVEQGVYSEVEAVKLAKAWAKEKLSNLAEGKLLKEELNGQEVKFLAQYIADAFTEEDAEGDRFSTYMAYTVGDIDGNSFELDTKATEKTPEDDAKYGTGRGWGGSFRIKPIEGGYEVRNSEKGGLVATISDQGELTMLDAEQSKAEMGGDTDYMERKREMSDYMEEGEDKKSNKMKKSELKEMIKAAMLAETSVEETLVDADQDMAEAILNALGGEAAFEAVVRAMSTDDAQTYLGAIMRDHDIEMGPVGDIPGFEGTMDALDALSIREEEDDVEDVEIDTEEEVDVDMGMDMDSEADGIDVKQDADTDLGGTVGDVQDNLEAALEAARELGDEKLEDQIGNTLTFFTRTHVVK